jgi:hypothetical protein
MELENLSPHGAHLQRGAVDDDQVYATLVARATYRVGAGGECELLGEPVPVRVEDAVDGEDHLESDTAPTKPAVDVFVLGAACPKPAPTQRMTVRVRVGKEAERSIVVSGDRTWQMGNGVRYAAAVAMARKGTYDPGALEATRPEPFARMPMSWKRAFGGEAPVDGGKVPYPNNPVGRGFLVYLEEAPGTFLPNLEHPEHPVSNWHDWPDPICFAPCPKHSRMRLERGMDIQPDGKKWSIKPELYSAAHPSMIFPVLEPGTKFEVEGMSPAGVFKCQLPSVKLKAKVELGAKSSELPLRLDTVELRPEARTISLVLRAPFRYYIHPGERRVTQLLEEGGGR